jgi:hypothetical protein
LPFFRGVVIEHVAALGRGISTATQGLSTKVVPAPVAIGTVLTKRIGSPFSSLLLSMKRETNTTLFFGVSRVKAMPE